MTKVFLRESINFLFTQQRTFQQPFLKLYIAVKCGVMIMVYS